MTNAAIERQQTTALAPVAMGGPASQRPALVYLARLTSPASQRTMRQALDTIAALATDGVCDADTMPWAALRYEHTNAIRARLGQAYAARTANKMLSALRGVLEEAWRLEQLDRETFARATDLKSFAVETPAQAERGRHATAGELAALLAACADGSKAGIRDAAILAVAYSCGLRRAELASLTLKSFDTDACTLTVKGKRNKTRVLPVTNGALGALLDWLHIRGTGDGPLYLRIRRGDHLTEAGITPQAVYTIIEARCAQAGVKTLRPHDMRRTFAGDLLDTGADIATVQSLMGHASPQTTAGYDRRPAETKRKAVARLHVPYRRVYA